MVLNLIFRIILGLILTILCELFVTYFSSYNKSCDIKCIILVNLITTPIFYYLIFCYYLFVGSEGSDSIIFVMQFLIAFIEYHLMKNVMIDKEELLFLSFTMNTVSYFAGFLG